MFYKNLAALRNNLGLTQREVAGRLGIPFQRYNHYETGRNEPDIETLKAIARFFDVSLDELLENEIWNELGRNKPYKANIKFDGNALDEILNLAEALQSKIKRLKNQK